MNEEEKELVHTALLELDKYGEMTPTTRGDLDLVLGTENQADSNRTPNED